MSDLPKAATAFAASFPRLVGKFPDNDSEELWVADIKACVPGGLCQVFRAVMFVEAQGAAYIFGVENEDGRPLGVRSELADRQQAFVEFLREQNEIMERSVGGLGALFQGSEYASEAKVTAAYMIHREHLNYLAIGYRSRRGEYLREKFDDSNDFLENARSMLLFDERDR
ncbi:hypothetical protein [Pseudomonas syringae]|uniref:hypothetical protein n=2 Tax=Pseudomonas syringae TaxID=317 RepID=UPI000464D559|nr:hypothetical protein [Pseudomonas syringae]UOF19500.1 hypothetical protein N023_23265 [Pseudomonas syringae CC440]UZA81896.1 hypothetical protein EZZ79_24255 [Pseudomonas syringae]